VLKKLLAKIKYEKARRANNFQKQSSVTSTSNHIEPIPESINQIKAKLDEALSGTSDFIMRTITLQNSTKTVILVAYFEGMVDIKQLNENIIKPLMEKQVGLLYEQRSTSIPSIIKVLKDNVLTCSDVEEINDFNQTIKNTLCGESILFVDGMTTALSINLPGVKSRNISEPLTDVVVRGPREGFTELLQVNKTMIRRRLKNPNLKFEYMTLGEQTSTKIAICYIKGIADEQIIGTLRKRLNGIDTDAILESGYLEAFIEDSHFTIFPMIGSSEKPDVITAKLLEGRIAILCDGTPFVLTVPFLLIEALQTSEDYYVGSLIASFSRVIRVIALFISVNLPGIYLALICFHQEVIPFKLLITMASSREGVPYSAFTEALFMLATFEILREAGIRMPRPVGSTVSIVGALVLGQSAVQAGLVSTAMVIVTAITAISGSTSTPLLGTIPIIRIAALILGNSLGLLGILLVNIALLIHLSTLRSFEIPYFSPFSPLSGTDLKDAIVRVPLWAMFTRPKDLTWGRTDKLKYREKLKIPKKEE
jgi:spore germination protein KA